MADVSTMTQEEKLRRLYAALEEERETVNEWDEHLRMAKKGFFMLDDDRRDLPTYKYERQRAIDNVAKLEQQIIHVLNDADKETDDKPSAPDL